MEVTKDFIEEMDKYRKPSDDNAGLLEACSENPVIFAERFFGFKLYAWQIYTMMKIVKGETTRNAVLCSRQIGKSELASILALWYALFNKNPNPKTNVTNVGIVAPRDDQAKRLISRTKENLKMANKKFNTEYVDSNGNPSFGEDFINKLMITDNTKEISFVNPDEVNSKEDEITIPEQLLPNTNGNTLMGAYPPTDTVRGLTLGFAVIDEADESDKITKEFLKKAFYPTGAASNSKFLFISTPMTPEGPFYQMVDPDDLYPDDPRVFTSVFTIDAIQYDNPDMYESKMTDIEQELKQGNRNSVRREYYAEYVQSNDTFFDPDSVRECFYKDMNRKTTFDKPCDMGVDFGGESTSKTVITISYFDEEKNVIKRLHDKTYEVGEDDSLMKDMEELMLRFNVDRVIPDDCAAGQYLIRRMKKKGWNVHPMSFRRDKVSKYTTFRSFLNRNIIRSYEDDDLQIEMLEMENRPARSRSVIAAPSNGSDDKIDSFVMSCYFYLEEDIGIEVVDMSNDKEEEEEEDRALKKIRRRRRRGGYDQGEIGWVW